MSSESAKTNGNAEVGATKIITNMKDRILSRYSFSSVPYSEINEHLASGEYIAAVIDIDDDDSEGIYTPMSFRKKGLATPIIGVAEDTRVGNEWTGRCAEFLDRGGDYLIPAPPNPHLLDASIGAAARRAHYSRSESVLEYSNGLTINFAQRKVRVNGRTIPFTRREIDMLMILASAAGRLVTKEVLLKNMYLVESDEPEIKIIDVFVCKIRAKLDAEQAGLSDVLKTEWARGYLLEKP